MRLLINILCVCVALIYQVKAAKILGIFPMVTYSHFTLGNRLMRELALRGHEVTYISSFADKTPLKGYTDVTISGLAKKMEARQKEINMFERQEVPKYLTPFIVGNIGLSIVEDTLSNDNVQALLHSNATFDLIILEQFSNDAARGFQHHYKAPCILYSSVGATSFVNHLVANPAPASYVPDMFLAYETKTMDFWQRLQNTVYSTYADVIQHLYYHPKQNDIMQKYFPGAPHLYNFLYDIPLILLNSHISISRSVPKVTNMVEIGGYHVFPPKKLPDNLQKYLDESKEGVILFSMGSNLKSKDMSTEKRDAILRTFAKLKLKVLWKWEDDSMPGQPKNVKVEKWLPQQDILPHPNIKLFITHGGLLSTTEAIYHGVPVIGIPIYGDQQTNMGVAISGGYGISVSYKELSEDLLTHAINEMLNNPTYSKNAKRRQRLMHDRPMTPIDTAMWWIEYVLRHPESDFYRSPGLDLTWYQFLLIDVLLFLFAVVAISICIFIFIVKKMCCRKNKKTKNTIQQKKNK